MTRLYLHVGIHKTGSTAFQSAHNQRRERLREYGITYLTAGLENGNHRRLADSIPRNDGSGESDCEIWRSAVEEITAAPQDACVISSENFDRLECNQVRWLSCKLKDIDTTIVVYLRPQAKLLVSQYNQQIKEGYIRQSLEAFIDSTVARRPRWLDFPTLLGPWMTWFGSERVKVRVAEADRLEGGSVVEDFFRLLGHNSLGADLRGSSWRNVSLNAEALEGIRDVLNLDEVWEIPREARRQVFRAFVRTLKQPDLFGGSEPGRQITERCRTEFAEDNKWVGDKCFAGNNVLDDCYLQRLESSGDQGCANNHVRAQMREWLIEYLMDAGYPIVTSSGGTPD